jgi:hypothetical protein
LRAACYSKHVNTVLPTLVQSKSLSCRFPTSQSPVTDVNMSIRPKKIVSSMLVLIPIINEKKWCVNCLRPPLSLRTMITMTHSYSKSVVLSQFLLSKDIQNPDPLLQITVISLLLYQILYSKSWEERKFQASSQTLVDIRLRPNLFQFHVSFFL